MSDEDIIKYYTNKHIHSWKEIPEEHKKYLNNRFSDSESIKESVWRILYHIEERPKCLICGKPVVFAGRKHNIFAKTCSKECTSKLKTNIHVQKGHKNKKQYTEEEFYYLSLPRVEKLKYTCLKKYGVEYPCYLDTNVFKTNNPQKNKEIKEKTKETRLNKYGQYMSPNNIKSLLTNETKNKRRSSFINTMIERYGDISYRNNEKHKQTCLEKYGVDSYSKTDEFKQIIENNYDLIQEKINNTKRKNNTFNTSKPENKSYELLKEKYLDVITHYKSKEYPFICDFYIPSLDLYIECNYHWTHGIHPYNENNKEDQILLESWKNKNTKYYNNAIYTWTVRDINKRNIAKQNNLNYIEFWNIEELINWIK